jgi:hypothetical protein
MDDLVAFLHARLIEDEQIAGLSTPGRWSYDDRDGYVYTDDLGTHTPVAYGTGNDGEHIARHDPARVLADIESKRRIIRLCNNMLWEHEGGPDVVAKGTLEYLALPYKDHPDYRKEWRPEEW